MIRRALPAALFAAALLAPGLPARAHQSKRLARVTRVFYAHRGPVQRATNIAGCPSPTTCNNFKTGKARWPVDDSGRLVMPFRYNDAGRPAKAPGADAVRAALRNSVAEWHRWNSNVTYSDAGTTNLRPGASGPGGSCADGVNAVGWRPLSFGILGVTYVCYDTRTRVIQEADTALNSTLPWGILGAVDPESKTFDVQSILTHELGHWLSLMDMYGLRATRLTMFGSGKPGTLGMRTLALGDITGSQAAYPCADGGRCPRDGIADD